MAGKRNGHQRDWGYFIPFILLAFLAAGCENGSDQAMRSNQAINETSPGKVQPVGADVCSYCHSRQTTEWMTGQHANLASHTATSGTMDSEGFPDYTEFVASDGSLAKNSLGLLCGSCHDQLGDGRNLISELTGNIDRPVVACESCHGGGANHFGVGQIPYPKPDAEQCGQCHNSNFDHNLYHPNADNIYEDYSDSPHSRSINDHALTANGDVEARCSRCHTDEGFRKYGKQVPGTTGHDSIVAYFTNTPDLANASDISCRTCHKAHTVTGATLEVMDASTVQVVLVPNASDGSATATTKLTSLTSTFRLNNIKVGDIVTVTGGANAGIYTVGTISSDTSILLTSAFPASETLMVFNIKRVSSLSRQFNTCTSCHQLTKPDGTGLTAAAKIMNGSTVVNGDSFAYHDPLINPYASLEEIIPDSHAAVPGDNRGNWKLSGTTQVPDQALFFVKKGDQHSCAVCHNPHAANTEINEQYAESGHGDQVDDPWIHYDWKATNRQSCQRCHTTTGFVNRVNSIIMGTAYSPANNDFTHLRRKQNETLYCYACHASVDVVHGTTVISPSYKGELRNPGAVVADYRAMDGSTVVFPDVSGSNVCLNCHLARESGGEVKNDTGNFAAISFMNSHYLTAGAILFKAAGFEFTTTLGGATYLDYANKSYFKHDVIGLPAAGSTVNQRMGEQGPCAGCHVISNSQSHRFLPIVKEGETITEITSRGCATCHSGVYEMTPAELQENEELFHASLEALFQALAVKGMHWESCSPYFYQVDCECSPFVDPLITDCDAYSTSDPVVYNSIRDWEMDGATVSPNLGKNNMGAAHNFQILEHDPGAYVHNRYYTKRLIYDSIDWLDDALMNDSVATTLPGLVSGSTLLEAQDYLLNSTGGRP